MGPESTATQRLNFAQSFNPFGAISGVIISQIFILSQLNVFTAAERAALPAAELAAIQADELNAVTMTYVAVGAVMVVLLLAIWLTRMPNLREEDKTLQFGAAFRRLVRNRNYVWGCRRAVLLRGRADRRVVVRHPVCHAAAAFRRRDRRAWQRGFDRKHHRGPAGVEPVAAGFYDFCAWIGLDDLLPRTAEQAGATYYILSLVLFVVARFVCTGLMRFFSPRKILMTLAVLAVACCLTAVYARGVAGVYGLMGISGCMSLMFPTIYSCGLRGLGPDTKIGGAGMVMAIAGAAVLTQIQGIVSDRIGSIGTAYWVPAAAFAVIVYYSIFICKEERVS